MNAGGRAGDQQVFLVVASIMEKEVAGELGNRQRARDCLSALLEEGLSKEERQYAQRRRRRRMGEKAEGGGQLRRGDGALKFRLRVQEISSTPPPLSLQGEPADIGKGGSRPTRRTRGRDSDQPPDWEKT